jgi:hypothetical protein
VLHENPTLFEYQVDRATGMLSEALSHALREYDPAANYFSFDWQWPEHINSASRSKEASDVLKSMHNGQQACGAEKGA